MRGWGPTSNAVSDGAFNNAGVKALVSVRDAKESIEVCVVSVAVAGVVSRGLQAVLSTMNVRSSMQFEKRIGVYFPEDIIP